MFGNRCWLLNLIRAPDLIKSHCVLKDHVISLVDLVTLILNLSVLSETESPWDSKKRESSLYIRYIRKVLGLMLEVTGRCLIYLLCQESLSAIVL